MGDGEATIVAKAAMGVDEEDLRCPICMSLFVDPFLTPCGHTFCHSCVVTHLEHYKRCPACSSVLTKDKLYPSFVLSKVVDKVAHMKNDEMTPCAVLQYMLSQSCPSLSAIELERLLQQVQKYKTEADRKEKTGRLDLLLHFLQESKDDKTKKLMALQRELECLATDIDKVEASCQAVNLPHSQSVDSLKALREKGQSEKDIGDKDRGELSRGNNLVSLSQENEKEKRVAAAIERLGTRYSAKTYDMLAEHPGMKTYISTQMPTSEMDEMTAGGMHLSSMDNLLQDDTLGGRFAELSHSKRRKIASQFEDLQNVYLRLRSNSIAASGDAAKSDGEQPSSQHVDREDDSKEGAIADDGLREFSRILSTLTYSNRLKIVAQIPRPSLQSSSSIISSVEYDREGKMFATAGVSKRISIFDYVNILRSNGTVTHCPIVEMVTRSKLSCLSWNRFVNSELASSDYEGVLNIWDTSTGNLSHEYEAHAKRIWCVDYCCTDPTLLATGSDDCMVKLWSTKSPSSIAQMDVKANVCAVKWHPGSPNELAVGSADHSVYVYDLRRQDKTLKTFTGHTKAVSYIRWASANEIVSASTDSTLRLWNTSASSTKEERIFKGHTNEKNFVGLAVQDDFIACGSESHEAYVYYKPLSKPIAHTSLPFESGIGGEREKPFISAVSWRPGKHELLVANSQGCVFVLRLVGSSNM